MLKKIFFVVLSLNLLMSDSIIAEDNSSVTEFVLFWAVAITGATVTVIYAPVVIPIAIANAKAAAIVAGTKAAAAGAAIKTGSVIVYTKAVAAGTAIKTGAAAAAPIVKTVAPAVSLVNTTVQIVEQAPEIKHYIATKVEDYEFSQAQKDFERCMNKHADQNTFIVPEICKKEELLFALLAEANIQRK